jgi:choline kinase
MKAILMAAGMGTRISKYIDKKAKCMVDIGGMSLIRHTVLMLLKNNVEVSIVLGYRSFEIYEELKDLNIDFYYNPFYNLTNSISSLWFAREKIGVEDLVIANADVFWEEGILHDILNDSRDVIMLSDKTKGIEGDYLFKFKDDILLMHGKDLDEKDVSGEYVGISRIKLDFQDKFIERLNYMIWNQQQNLWWENVLYSFIGERNIYIKDVSGKFWSEVDFIEDYYRLLEYRKCKFPLVY